MAFEMASVADLNPTAASFFKPAGDIFQMSYKNEKKKTEKKSEPHSTKFAMAGVVRNIELQRPTSRLTMRASSTVARMCEPLVCYEMYSRRNRRPSLSFLIREANWCQQPAQGTFSRASNTVSQSHLTIIPTLQKHRINFLSGLH